MASGQPGRRPVSGTSHKQFPQVPGSRHVRQHGRVSAFAQPERTPDGRYIRIGGRRWRATDPEIPEDAAARLRSGLMAARRAVKAAMKKGDTAAEKRARSQVHSAKVALGERGTPWWEQSMAQRRQRWDRGLAACEAEQPDKEYPA